MKNKKRIALVSTALIATSSAALFFVNAQQTSHIIIDGQRVNVSQPINRNNRLHYSVRDLADNLGADIEWNPNNNSIRITREDTTISMEIGSNRLHVPGLNTFMSTSPFLHNDRAYLPIRYIASSLGYSVSFDESQRVPVLSAQTPSQPIPQQPNNQNQMPSWYNPALHREVRPRSLGGYTIRWTEAGLEKLTDYVIYYINAERRDASPRNRMLVSSPVHTTEARVRAQEMSILFEHVRPHTRGPLLFEREIGSRSGGGAVHTNHPERETAQTIVQSFMNSPAGHGYVVLEPSTWPEGSLAGAQRDYNVIGVGSYQVSGGTVFTTVIFDRTD